MYHIGVRIICDTGKDLAILFACTRFISGCAPSEPSLSRECDSSFAVLFLMC